DGTAGPAYAAHDRFGGSPADRTRPGTRAGLGHRGPGTRSGPAGGGGADPGPLRAYRRRRQRLRARQPHAGRGGTAAVAAPAAGGGGADRSGPASPATRHPVETLAVAP